MIEASHPLTTHTHIPERRKRSWHSISRRLFYNKQGRTAGGSGPGAAQTDNRQAGRQTSRSRDVRHFAPSPVSLVSDTITLRLSSSLSFHFIFPFISFFSGGLFYYTPCQRKNQGSHQDAAFCGFGIGRWGSDAVDQLPCTFLVSSGRVDLGCRRARVLDAWIPTYVRLL